MGLRNMVAFSVTEGGTHRRVAVWDSR